MPNPEDLPTKLRGIAATLETGIVSPKLLADLAAELREIADATAVAEVIVASLAQELATGAREAIDRPDTRIGLDMFNLISIEATDRLRAALGRFDTLTRACESPAK